MIDSPAILDQEHLDVRLQLLEIGAFFDRLNRAEGEVSADDLRLQRMRKALRLLSDEADQAHDLRVQKLSLLFSGDDA